MSASLDQAARHRRDIFEGSLSGAQSRPFVPRLRSDPSPWHSLPRDLAEYREQEGKERREVRLRALWRRLPTRRTSLEHSIQWTGVDQTGMNPERAERLRAMYEDELMNGCASSGTTSIDWKDFLDYADKKEEGKSDATMPSKPHTYACTELWTIFHDELDLDNNGRLDAEELAEALGKAGVQLHLCED